MSRTLRFKSISHLRRELGPNIRVRGGETQASLSHKASDTQSLMQGEEGPQDILWRAVMSNFSNLEPQANYNKAVPGRRFEADIAFPSIGLALEVDGWCFHGKFKSGFKRDRLKSKLFALNGWRTLNFTASEIYNNLPECIVQIEQMVSVCIANTPVR